MPVKKAAQSNPNLLLRRARQEQGWSQKEIADRIGVSHAFMISRWENGTAIPGPEYRQRLCALFGKSPRELGFSRQSSEPIVPHPAFPIFDPMLPFRLASAQSIVGRQALLVELTQRLSRQKERQLFALSGLPGVGKTTLVMELANSPEIRDVFQDGVLWAALGPQANVIAVLSRWGELLGLSEGERKALRSYEDWASALRVAIGTRRLLFIIDDAWNLEEALQCKVGGPACSYIITTRIPEIATYFAGDQAFHVPELSLNDGIDLITQIAPALMELSPEAPQKLVESVGGLPLALILIGNYLLLQTRHLQRRRTEAALLQLREAEKRLMLEFPMAAFDRDARLMPKMSLQAVIQMSEARLDGLDRQALSALAVFPPKPETFSEDAALTVAAVEGEVLDRLVDAGMIEANQQGRYQMHQVISDYERLQGKNREAEMRLVTYMVEFAERARVNYRLLEPDLSVLMEALRLASEQQQELLVRGAVASSRFLYARGLQSLSETLLREALLSSESSRDIQRRAEVLRELTNITKMRGDYAEAEKLAQECLSLLLPEKSSAETLSEILAHLGHIFLLQGNYEQAKSYLQEGIPFASQPELARHLCRLYGLLGVVVNIQGDIGQAEIYWREGLRAAEQSEEPGALSYICGVLGGGLCNAGRYQEAEEYIQKGLELARQIGSRPEICHFLLDLGELALKQGESDQAEAYLQQSLELARLMRLHPALSAILLTLGELALEHGEDGKAEGYLREGMEFALQRGNRDFVSAISSMQGEMHLQRNETAEARNDFLLALEHAPEESWLNIARASYGLARVYLLCGEEARAREQGEKSLDLFEKIKNPLAEQIRQWLERFSPAD
jgi:tetratricopeptide (TPR) repeat protein/transcriptional regulator with XRE-family HTH domain